MCGGSHRAARALAVVLLALVAACSKPTGVVIHIESDITGGFTSLDTMRLTLRYGDSTSPIVDQIPYEPGQDTDHPIPGNIPIYATDPEETRTLDVLIETGLGADNLPRAGGAAISEHFVVRMRPHHLLRLDVHLDMECINRMCGAGNTCGAGGVCMPSTQGGCDFGTPCVDDVVSIDVPFTAVDGGADADPPMDASLDADPPADVSIDVPLDRSLDAPVDGAMPPDVAMSPDVQPDVAADGPFPDAGCVFMTVQCGATCVSTGSNHDNCGSCGHTCATVESCSASSCIQLSCAPSNVHCPGDMAGFCPGSPAVTTTCAAACGAAGAMCSGLYTCVAPYARDYACCRSRVGVCTAGEFTVGAYCCTGQ